MCKQSLRRRYPSANSDDVSLTTISRPRFKPLKTEATTLEVLVGRKTSFRTNLEVINNAFAFQCFFWIRIGSATRDRQRQHQASSGKWKKCCAVMQEAEVCLIDSGLIDHLKRKIDRLFWKRTFFYRAFSSFYVFMSSHVFISVLQVASCKYFIF